MTGGDDTQVLMMTGLDDVESIKRAYDTGATDFITKPINWVLLGHTTGRGKNDHTNKPNRPIKEVLGLPLVSRFRELLSQL